MNPVTHLLTGWVVANTAHVDRKDRLIVTIAGVISDVDAAGIIAETVTRSSERPLLWWSEYHHVLAHNLGFGLLVTIVSFLLAKQKAKAATLAAISFHLHLLADLVGARGPDGYQWPLPYLLPFSDAWQWTWTGQWELNAWPNFANYPGFTCDDLKVRLEAGILASGDHFNQSRRGICSNSS